MGVTLSNGTTLGVKFSGSTYTELANVELVGERTVTTTPVVINFLKDDAPAKYGSGRKEYSTMPVTLAYESGSAQHAAIIALVGSQGLGAVLDFEVNYPDADPEEFSAIVVSVSKGEAAPGGYLRSVVTLDIVSEVA